MKQRENDSRVKAERKQREGERIKMRYMDDVGREGEREIDFRKSVAEINEIHTHVQVSRKQGKETHRVPTYRQNERKNRHIVKDRDPEKTR